MHLDHVTSVAFGACHEVGGRPQPRRLCPSDMSLHGRNCLHVHIYGMAADALTNVRG